MPARTRSRTTAKTPSATRPATLTELLGGTVIRRGSDIAVGDAETVLTWSQFGRRVEGFAAYLADLGVRSGTAVAIWLPNGVDYLTAIFALARLAAPAVHVNTRFGSVEVGDVLDRSAAKVLITRTKFGAIDLRPTLTAVDRIGVSTLGDIVFTDALPELALGVRMHCLVGDLDGDCEDASTADAPCLIYTSSGTTARPKLVMHDQASIAGHAHDVMKRIALDQPDAVLLAAVPFCGTFGNVAAMAAVAGGAQIVCSDVFDPAAAAAAIRAQAITHLFGDDRMIGLLADQGDLPSVRFSAVAAFHPDAVASIDRAVAAGLAPHSIYGSSEAQALFALAPQISGEQVAVTPVSAAADARVDNDELELRGPSLFRYYLGDPQRSAAARDGDGFFRTGDHAELMQGGFFFRSRIDDVLRLGGFLVNPREIEDFLARLPGVAGAQVVAVDHGGRVLPFAFLVAQPGADVREADVIAACRAALARYKVPVRVLLVDDFPTIAGPNGIKIQRGRLREIAQAAVARPHAANDSGPSADTKLTETG